MRKTLAIIAIVALLGSCNTKPAPTTTTIETPVSQQPAAKKTLRLERFLISFYTTNPNWYQNDVTEKKANEQLKQQLPDSINAGLLEDYPVKLREVNEYSKGKYAAHFSSDYATNLNYDAVLADVNFDLVCLVDEKMVPNLRNDEFYTVKGDFKKFLKAGELEKYINGVIYSYTVKIKHDALGMPEEKEVDLGVILMDAKQVTSAAKL